MQILNLQKSHFIYWKDGWIRVFEIDYNQDVFDYIYRHMTTFMDYCKLNTKKTADDDDEFVPLRMKPGLKDEIISFIMRNTKQKLIYSNEHKI